MQQHDRQQISLANPAGMPLGMGHPRGQVATVAALPGPCGISATPDTDLLRGDVMRAAPAARARSAPPCNLRAGPATGRRGSHQHMRTELLISGDSVDSVAIVHNGPGAGSGPAQSCRRRSRSSGSLLRRWQWRPAAERPAARGGGARRTVRCQHGRGAGRPECTHGHGAGRDRARPQQRGTHRAAQA
jgi:hypothetical protein